MAENFFGVNLQEVIGQAFTGNMTAGTLHKVTLAEDGYGGFTPTFSDVAIEGRVESYTPRERSERIRSGFDVPVTDLKVMVLRYNLSEEITKEDEISFPEYGRMTIVIPEDSSANAIYEIQARLKTSV